MARGHQPLGHGAGQGAIAGHGLLGAHLWHMVADGAQQGRVFRTAQFRKGDPQHIDQVAGPFGIHGDGLADVIDLGHGREQQGGRDGDLGATDLIVVFHRVLARDAGHPVDPGDIVQGAVGPHQLGQLVRAVRRLVGKDRVAPAKVVEPGHDREVGAHGHGVAHPLVDGRRRHVIGVDVRVARADAVGDDHPFEGIEQRPDHRGVRRTVVGHAGERLDHRAALHLVVVLADDVFLGTDVQPAQQLPQGAAQVGACRQRGLGVFGWHPAGHHPHGRQPLVDKLHVHVAHGFALVEQVKLARVREGAEHRGLHVHGRAQGHEFVELGRRHGQGHALLGLGDKDLPRLQAGVLQGGTVEVQFKAAGVLGHLAHRGGQAAGAVVGHAVIQPQVAGLQEAIEHLLLGDRVADLHRGGRRALVQFLGGEGGAVDAVLADAAAGHDDLVAGHGELVLAWLAEVLGRHDAHRAAEDQGLAGKALVKDQRTVHRGDAGLVAAVLHA